MNGKYYFVTWLYLKTVDGRATVGGSKVLAFLYEFNLHKAHIDLQSENNGEPVIILSWQEISENQARQYKSYVDDVTAKQNKGKKPNLKIIDIKDV